MEKAVQKNEEYTITIDGMGYEGEGVGRINGFTIFIPGAIVNEKVRIKIVKINKNFAFGKIIEIIEESKDRLKAKCNIYKRCGGCQLQHISYNLQLNFKKTRVIDCLKKIGKFNVEEDSGIDVLDTIGMKNPWRYRNKVQLPVGSGKEGINIGFYAKRSHEIIDMDSCCIQDRTADKVIKIIRNWMSEYNIEPYDEKSGKGIVRHIMVRRAFSTDEVMVVIITAASRLPFKSEIIELITKNICGVKSIVQNINSKKTNTVLGGKCITLWGEESIHDYIGKFKFRISPLSFFQVNPVQTEILYNKVLEYAELTGNEIVFDAYCGTGTISLFLSQRAKKVYGVEIVEQAIENARLNAAENGIDNAEFIVGKSEVVIPGLIDDGIEADVVVVDPPRKGCERVLLDAIARMKPKRIVYVSCNPSTLARDLKILEELGYSTKEVQPVDMFCQTAHVECIVKLSSYTNG